MPQTIYNTNAIFQLQYSAITKRLYWKNILFQFRTSLRKVTNIESFTEDWRWGFELAYLCLRFWMNDNRDNSRAQLPKGGKRFHEVGLNLIWQELTLLLVAPKLSKFENASDWHLVDGHCRHCTDIDCEKVCIHWGRVKTAETLNNGIFFVD